MQRLFSADGPWTTPWLDRVLPVVTELASRHPERTVFTRFIPPERATDMPGLWQRYYSRWKDVTRQHLDPALLELLPSLANALITLFRQRYTEQIEVADADVIMERWESQGAANLLDL